MTARTSLILGERPEGDFIERDRAQAHRLHIAVTLRRGKGFQVPSTKPAQGQGRRAAKKRLLRLYTAKVVLAQPSGQSGHRQVLDLNKVRAGVDPRTDQPIG